MSIDWETVKLISMLDELALKTASGYIDFDAATDDDSDLVLIDKSKEDYLGSPIVRECLIDDFNHDIVSYYGDDLQGIIVRAVDDQHDSFVVVKATDSDCFEIVIDDGNWCFV